MIKKIVIKNYRVFRDFELDLHPGMNILVGDNGAGKSTILEAINIALTGRLGRIQLSQDLSPYLFNSEVVAEYLTALAADQNTIPPEFIIELYFEGGDDLASLVGTNNLLGEDVPGVRVRASIDHEYAQEYAEYVSKPHEVRLVPTEYYRVERLDFGGNAITNRSIPASVSMIDAAAIRLQNGTDYYLQQIITDTLDRRARVELARTYRSFREQFSGTEAISNVNTKLSASKGELTDRDLSLGIDVSQRTAWESNLVPHLDDLPFQFIGNGERNALKILLALNRDIDESHIVLIEEPENHLSFSRLHSLVAKISAMCKDKQVIATTHSSYVLNKLGLDNLILLAPDGWCRLTDLEPSTLDYFKRLPGYDTLRLLLARRIIIVEGISDELVVQRAYLDQHGVLPIEDGVDVLSARNLSAKRFLDLAIPLKRRVSVVTDGDGDQAKALARFSEYAAYDFISIHSGIDAAGKTLEPQLLSANDLQTMNTVLGKSYTTEADLLRHMGNKNNKAVVALSIFESETKIQMPEYILEAIKP